MKNIEIDININKLAERLYQVALYNTETQEEFCHVFGTSEDEVIERSEIMKAALEDFNEMHP